MKPDNTELLIEIVLILLTAGTNDNAGHVHGSIDQRSRLALEGILRRLEAI